MKASANTQPSTVKVLASLIIFKASGERIVTKTARLKIEEAKQRHEQRIREMQQALDKEHQELRGWTNATRNNPKVPTREMNAKLLQEFEKGRAMLMTSNV